MADNTYLVDPKPPPVLNIPQSSSIVDVRIIDSTLRISLNMNLIMTDVPRNIKFYGVAYSFLITHKATNKHYLFDLGMRKDPENLSRKIADAFTKSGRFKVQIDKNVSEILDADQSETPIHAKDISGIIWSHHHADHTGDPSSFPPTTELIVGPGFRDEFMPGYPTNPDAAVLDSDWAGRTLREVDIKHEGKGLKIGRLEAMDFFGDGSFYLLNTPGHSVGHMCGLARVSTSPDTFMFMGGDACHHGAEIRPTEYLPLPTSIKPSPLTEFVGVCPGSVLQNLHRTQSATQPFCVPQKGFNHDIDVTLDTLEKMYEFDAAENVLVIAAHDTSLLDDLVLYPKTFNHWRSTAIKEKTRWKFAGELFNPATKSKQSPGAFL